MSDAVSSRSPLTEVSITVCVCVVYTLILSESKLDRSVCMLVTGTPRQLDGAHLHRKIMFKGTH